MNECRGRGAGRDTYAIVDVIGGHDTDSERVGGITLLRTTNEACGRHATPEFV